MSKRKDLTPAEILELRENPWIDSVNGQHISYSEDFKKEAYRELMDGKSMRTIFFEHGINPDVVGDGRMYVLTCRLRKRANSEDGFKDLRANNQRKPVKLSKEQTLAARVSDLEHELAYTRQEVEFLKNTFGRFGGSEVMGIQAAPEIKYALIREAFLRDDNLLKISKMCEIAGVSRSGYYSWCTAEPRRKERDTADRSDFDLVLEAYRFRGYAKGARGIHMRLLHMGIIMNVKKIRRLMRKYSLRCPIRAANPYRRMAAAMQTSTIAPNLVNREFDEHGPRKILLTDITYLFFKNGKCYLSTILDGCTHEILAYCVSLSLKVEFVLNTVNDLIAKHGSSLDNETIVHSDQGCHYTSLAFIQKLKDAEFVQSMSRRGNCWDNAPQESFFGHMKDHLKSKIALCSDFAAVQAQVDDFIDYYNNDCGQWDLMKLTPSEYYQYLQTGLYPLPVWTKE